MLLYIIHHVCSIMEHYHFAWNIENLDGIRY